VNESGKMTITLDGKIGKSKEVLKEALDRFPGKIALAWTGKSPFL
jgi:hypothetical protein